MRGQEKGSSKRRKKSRYNTTKIYGEEREKKRKRERRRAIERKRRVRCKMKLNHKQEKFVEFYAGGMSGTKAAMAAGYSKRSAHAQASRLLKDSKIREEVERRLKEEAIRKGFTKERVIEEIKSIAFGDKVNINYKLRALDMACRILGMYVDKVDLSGSLAQTVDFSKFSREEILKMAGIDGDG